MKSPAPIETIAAIIWLSVNAEMKISIAINAPPKSRMPSIVQRITAKSGVTKKQIITV